VKLVSNPEVLVTRTTGAGVPHAQVRRRMAAPVFAAWQRTQYKIEMDAPPDGVCISTLRRAKFDLGVLSAKDGVNGPWYWSQPPQEEPQPAVKEPG
jgi:hypothetical protein